MNFDDRQRLLAEMMKGVPAGTAAHKELEEMCIRDLEALEPLIDQIIERELKDCVAIVAKFMTETERLSILRRVKQHVKQHDAQTVRH
jgi:hypothetical protein